METIFLSLVFIHVLASTLANLDLIRKIRTLEARNSALLVRNARLNQRVDELLSE